jgi:hypothetical protein
MTTSGRPAAPQASRDAGGHVGAVSTAGALDGAARSEGVDERYRLISIAAVRAPEGCVGGDWHVYRISQGENGITGYRRGDLAGVTADVEAILIGLNERRQWATSKAAAKSQRVAAAARHVRAK